MNRILDVRPIKGFYCLLVMLFLAAGCADDEVTPKPEPSLDNVEVGYNNNEIGVIGRDFHFNADIVAGDRIDTVRIIIQQRSDETYAKPWSFEIKWEQYKGARNATVHKHFNIPEDAAEGKYDYRIVVNDENGTTLKEIRTINLYLPENLPVDPQLSIFNISRNSTAFYRNEAFIDGTSLRKGDVFSAQVTIEGLKGDGKMYLLLINKKLNHRPETIDAIDFSKAIVYDVYEHTGWEAVDFFSNFVFDMETFTTVRPTPRLTIGAATDNNTPAANSIDGSKAWESGDYYYGVVYENTTYKMTFHHYVEFEIDYN